MAAPVTCILALLLLSCAVTGQILLLRRRGEVFLNRLEARLMGMADDRADSCVPGSLTPPGSVVNARDHA